MRKTSEKHPMVFSDGILGFQGYSADGVFCLKANGDNNFLLYGIAENSLLVVDSKQPFVPDRLNAFRTGKVRADADHYKLSLEQPGDLSYAGRVILSVMQYE